MLPNSIVNLCVSLYFKVESVWTYFNGLDQADFPSPEELFQAALLLYDNYSTPMAGTIFALGCQPNSPIIPIGEPWRKEEDTESKPAPAETDDVDSERGEDGSGEGGSGEDERKEGGSGKDQGKKGGSGKDEEKEGTKKRKDKEFNGDRTLMRSALLMYEALVSKEVAQAVAEGDIGRVYEGVKVGCPPNPSLSFLTRCSSCFSHSRDPRTTSIPATCLKRSPS